MFFLISNRQGSPFASGKPHFFSYIQGQTVFQATVRGQKCTHTRIKELHSQRKASQIITDTRHLYFILSLACSDQDSHSEKWLYFMLPYNLVERIFSSRATMNGLNLQKSIKSQKPRPPLQINL